MKIFKGLSRRRLFATAAGLFLGIASSSLANAQALDQGFDETTDFNAPKWVATWSIPPMAHGSAFGGSRSFENQTVRQIVHISAGGTKIRVKLSNEYGVGPLIIGSAGVAFQATDSAIIAESNHSLTFNGRVAVVIPQGGTALSDPIRMNVPSNANLAISVYLPQNTGFATYHENGNQTAYISSPGDFTDAADIPVQDTSLSRYFLTFVEVLPQRKIGALAIIGDSVSEGATTTLNANRRMNDVISRWLNAGPDRLAILNQGTGCGRLLRDVCGPSGVSRFERDVLNATGVTQVLIALGYVDIIYPTAFGAPDEIVSADQIITGLRQLIHRAKQRGLRVYGATFPPNGSTPFPNVYTPENEAKRQTVNRWIRTTREFDAVADYDLTLRDPSNPIQLRPAYDSGDGIHPNDAGHEALARTIVLSLR